MQFSAFLRFRSDKYSTPHRFNPSQQLSKVRSVYPGFIAFSRIFIKNPVFQVYCEALFTRTDIQCDTDIEKYLPDIILYWRIEYRVKMVLHPFCPTKSGTPLTQCYNNTGPIFLKIGVGLNIVLREQGGKTCVYTPRRGL